METAQKVVRHPLAAVAGYLETLLGKLNMELEVAPTDIRSHRDLRRAYHSSYRSGIESHTTRLPSD